MDSGHKNRTGWPPHVSFGDFAFGYNPLRLLAFGHHSRLFIGRVAPESSLSWMDSLLTATRIERCLFLRADVIPGPAYRRSRPCRPLSPTAISPCARTTLSLVMEPASKGQVPRRGFASRPSVFPKTPYGPGRFKGPFGSPLIAPTFTHGASASRSRPHRIVSFRRRAILRRFVPHPRKMAKSRRLVLAKASHPLTNRRGRLVPPRRHPPHGFSFHKRVDPPVPFKRQERTRSAVAASESRIRGIGTGGPQWIVPVTAIGPGSKFRPDRCRRLLRPATTRDHAPCFNGPPAPQKNAACGPDQRCFPPSVSPLWNPPFLIPPSNSNTPKGGNRRGQQRGVFTGAAEETAGPLSPLGAAPRRPSG